MGDTTDRKDMRGVNNFLICLLAFLILVFVWSGISPYNRGVWYVEMTSVLIVFFGLLFTCRLFRFSNIAYAIVSIWLIMHAIGAHYSFELVPFDWITDTFGFSRNHYDRVAHFAIGLNSYGIAEFMLRTHRVKNVGTAVFVGILFIMAMANAWELIEWGYAELDGGEVGAAFLGSQGDIWDAQKDMLSDTIGAFFGAICFAIVCRKHK